MDILVWFIGFFLIAELLGIPAARVGGCLGGLVLILFVCVAVYSVEWYWILLIVLLSLGVCWLLDRFFPMDENGNRLLEKKRPFPVALERPDKFELPNRETENGGKTGNAPDA